MVYSRYEQERIFCRKLEAYLGTEKAEQITTRLMGDISDLYDATQQRSADMKNILTFMRLLITRQYRGVLTLSCDFPRDCVLVIASYAGIPREEETVTKSESQWTI